MIPTTHTVRLAAMADVHLGTASPEWFRLAINQVPSQADMLVICGDLTNYGTVEEAQLFARELSQLGRFPIVAVLGNHEFESGHQHEIKDVLAQVGVVVLDGDAWEFNGLGFAGVKGFGGGFGQRTLEPWGEPAVKQFVQSALDEVLKLESALARLRTQQRVVLLHYSPVQETVEGEPPEIFPFLGSSRFEEPLNRYDVTAVFHGHAHRGALQGRTRAHAPVYNVAAPLLRKSFPDRPPFRVVELGVTASNEGLRTAT